MKRLYKPARSKETSSRGVFSYIAEFVNELLCLDNPNNEELKLYCDFSNAPPFISKINLDNNFYNYIYEQDKNDYLSNKLLYYNLEDQSKTLYQSHGMFDSFLERKDIRAITEKIINKYLILESSLKYEISDIGNKIDFNNTIGIFRRTFEMHWDAVNLDKYFKYIDESGLEYIFLTCDNKYDTELFKEKYGKRLICLEKYSGCALKLMRLNEAGIDAFNHVRELIRNTYLLSKTKKLIKTKSNMSIFVLMLNSELDFIDITESKQKTF
jgi:hypothetical protein